MEVNMFKIMLLVATVDLIDLQLRLITNVTLSKISDYYGGHNFPVFVYLHDFDSYLTLFYRLQVVWQKSRYQFCSISRTRNTCHGKDVVPQQSVLNPLPVKHLPVSSLYRDCCNVLGFFEPVNTRMKMLWKLGIINL